MGVLREVFTGKVLDYLTEQDKDTFLDGVPDMSQHIISAGNEAQIIHMLDVGILPEVLVNNTTYPMGIEDAPETDVPIQLDRLNTKATRITDDELYALTYDKIGLIVSRHGLAIQIVKTRKALHSLAPSGNTANMPVLLTTGPDDGTGRKRLLWEDISAFKTSLDNLEVPEMGRRLVLSKDHENDLTYKDQRFAQQYYNRSDGKVYNQLGFDFHTHISSPYYTPATKTKLSFGAVPGATDRKASVFFSTSQAVKCIGWVKMYFSEASKDPLNQRNLVNFRHNHIVLRTREAYAGAIVSDNAL